jgi:hypothetical protein
MPPSSESSPGDGSSDLLSRLVARHQHLREVSWLAFIAHLVEFWFTATTRFGMKTHFALYNF